MFHRPKSDDQANPGSNGVSNAAPTAGSSPNNVGAPGAAPVVDKSDAAQQAPSSSAAPVQAGSGQSVPPGSTQNSPQNSGQSMRPLSQSHATTAQAAKPDSNLDKEVKMNTPSDKTTDSSQSSEGYSRPLDIPGTAAFQRPGATGPQTPRAGYTPGSYGATPSQYGTAATAPASSSSMSPSDAHASKRRLVVGEGITMSGEIESCDTLIVEGTVEAALKGASVLEIAETGMFYGTVEIDECTIAGRFEGDITVHGRLTVKASGSITGSIAYKELAVDAGATVDGKMSPLSAGKKAEKKENKGGKLSGKMNSQGGELPFAGHATAAE